MGDLAERLKISLSTLSRQLQQKKTLSFVEITRSESDSSKIVALNKTGIKKIDELEKTLGDLEKAFLSGLSDQEVKVFNQVFDKLVKKTELNSIN